MAIPSAALALASALTPFRWAILIGSALMSVALGLQFLYSYRRPDLPESSRFFFRVASQALLLLAVIPVFYTQYRSIIQGQTETKVKIESLAFKAGERRIPPASVSPEKASQIQEFLRPYRRLYFYLDKDRIGTDYREYGDKATLVSYEVELGTALKTQIGASIEKYLESKAFEDDRQKIIGKYVVAEKPVEVKYEELERYYLTAGMIQSGLESLQIVTSDSDDFTRQIDTLMRTFSFQISKDAINAHRTRLIEKAAATLASNLDNVRGSVLVAGDFRVDPKAQTEEFLLTHPATQRFNLPHPITFHFAIPKDKLELPASALLQNARQINLRVFGEFIRNDTEASEHRYEIVPVAVYRGAPPPATQ